MIIMQTKKITALITVAAIVSCLALAGCANNQPAQPASTASTQTPAATAQSSTATAQTQAAPAQTQAAPAQAPAQNQTNYIGEAAARDIALRDAGLTVNDVSKLSVELDHENGVVVYDVDFKHGGKEYDYDIDPNNGAIIRSSSKIDD